MPSVRDHFGSNCPSCRNDILQAAPSKNRMPGEEVAWCPSCDSRFDAEALAAGKSRGGLLKRLFGGRPSNA